jgi:DNA polymerase-1
VSGRKRFYNLPPYSHPDYKRQAASVERRSKNAGIQGANADTIKQSMIYLVDRLEKGGYDAKLVLTVHDELVVECHKDQRYEVAEVVSKSLIDGFGHYFSLIPMTTDALIGPCWLKSACEAEDDKGNECGGTEFHFDYVEGNQKLICDKCGGIIA